MTEDKKQTKENFLKREVAYGITGGEWVTAAFLGTTSGLITAAKTIRDRFMYDLKKSTTYAPKFEEYAQDMANITLANSENNPKLLLERLNTRRETHVENVAEWSRDFRGVEDSMIKGTWQRFMTHTMRSKMAILFNSVIGLGIGAGMAISFFNGVATRARMEKIEDALTQTRNTSEKSPPTEQTPEAESKKHPHHRVNHAQHHNRIHPSPEREAGISA